MFFLIAVEELSLRVQEEFHLMLCVIPPPDAHAGGSVDVPDALVVSNFRL